MGLVVAQAQMLPVGANTLKIALLVLALLSTVTGLFSYKRIESEYEDSGDVSRQPVHILFNILTVVGGVLLIVNQPSTDAGWIFTMFATSAFVSGIFTYRSMQIQMDRGDDKIDKPSMHLAAGLFLVMYAAYMSLWHMAGIGGLFFA
ncbi:MAG: hypothetical protein SV253_03780 [Halobacteria archaeon]|nr:hypothetical protein [Halobacteria archaeon]